MIIKIMKTKVVYCACNEKLDTSFPSDVERRLLLQSVAGLLVGIGSGSLWAQPTNVSTATIQQGIHRVTGEVYHNNHLAKIGDPVKVGDVLKSTANSEAVVVVGNSAFLLREQSHVEMITTARSWVRSFLRLVTGGLLGVFGRGEPRIIRTSAATIGIRGTGLYLEADQYHTYICDCYGIVDLASSQNKHLHRETVQAQHHSGRIIQQVDSHQPWIRAAPMQGHQDHELIFLESLVRRQPPSTFFKS